MKKVLLWVASIFLSVFLLGSITTFADNNISYTIDSYKDFLQETDIDTFNQFSRLSQWDQEIFLSYINNPEKLKAAIENPENTHGEVVMRKNIVSRSEWVSWFRFYNSSRLRTQHIEFSNALNILGIDVIRITAWMKYQHDGSKIREILSSGTRIDRNISVISGYDVQGETSYHDGNIATYQSYINVTFSYSALNLRLVTVDMGVRWNIYGRTWYWWQPLLY